MRSGRIGVSGAAIILMTSAVCAPEANEYYKLPTAGDLRQTVRCSAMKTTKKGNNWTAYFDPETGRYFAEIMYTSREGREQYDYEITEEIYGRLGTFADDVENERLIKTGEMAYSFENTMYGTLGPERTVWDEEADAAMEKSARKKKNKN